MHSIFSLCQILFYVLLSGEVGVIIKNDNLGKFGDRDKDQVKNGDDNELILHKSKRYYRNKKTLSILVESSELLSVSKKEGRRNHRSLIVSKKNSIDSGTATPNTNSKPYPKSIFGQAPKGTEPIEVSIERKRTSKPELFVETSYSDALPAQLEEPKRAMSEVGGKLGSAKKRLKSVFNEVLISNTFKRLVQETKHPASTGNSPYISFQALDASDLESMASSSARDDDDKPLESLMTEESMEEKEEKSEFELQAEQYGRIIRYLKEGEGFGEIALKRSIPRTASILCKTDCDVLIMKKEHYELGFGKMQREKEEFLNSVFPMLKTNISSLNNYNYLLYSFKVK